MVGKWFGKRGLQYMYMYVQCICCIILYTVFFYTFLSRYGNLELNMSFFMTNLFQGAITEDKSSATHVVYGPPPPFPEGWKNWLFCLF